MQYYGVRHHRPRRFDAHDQRRENIPDLSAPRRAPRQGRSERNGEISVSKEGGQKKVSGYRNGLRVEVAGTLFLNAGAKSSISTSLPTVSARRRTSRIPSRANCRSGARWARTSRNGRTKRISPTRCSLHSAPKRSMRISSTSGCVSSASTGNVKSGCNRASR